MFGNLFGQIIDYNFKSLEFPRKHNTYDGPNFFTRKGDIVLIYQAFTEYKNDTLFTSKSYSTDEIVVMDIDFPDTFKYTPPLRWICNPAAISVLNSH